MAVSKHSAEINLSLFSPHIFWDVDIAKINVDINKKWLVKRVLEYGLINDWQIIYKYYGGRNGEVVRTGK